MNEEDIKNDMRKIIDKLKIRATEMFPLGMDAKYVEEMRVKCDDGRVIPIKAIGSVKLLSSNVFQVILFSGENVGAIKTALSNRGVVSSDKNAVKLVLNSLTSEEKARLIQEFKDECERARTGIRDIRQKYRKMYCDSKKKSDQEAGYEKKIDTQSKVFDDSITDIYKDFDKRITKL